MLTRWLNALAEAGLRRYSERPPRDEYLPTRLGRDFSPVLIALRAFGNRHFAPEGASVEIIDAITGEPAEPALVDKKTGRPLVSPEFVLAAGPAADEAIRRRYDRVAVVSGKKRRRSRLSPAERGLPRAALRLGAHRS